MNHVYRLVWSDRQNAWVAVSELARGRKKGGGKLAAATLCLVTVVAQAAPGGGQVVSGSGQISSSGNATTITQSSPNLSLNWSSFNIAPQETVSFLQPSASAVAVNHIFDTSGTRILGHLNANGQVYLINPNGILFGKGAVVNVGGLVASTLNPTDANPSATTRAFSGAGTGSVSNEGTITATPGGYVVLIGNRVSNTGTIVAQMGSVTLGAGSAVTLTFASNQLVSVQVDASTLNNLAANGGLIQADGGKVIMTAGARDALLASAVNNTGVVEARTVEEHDGTITLLAGMSAGKLDVGGTLDASAPNGGNGGAIETSAAQVSVANNARITTQAPQGLTGSWLVDPQDFTVAASGGDITGSALSSELATTNVQLQSSHGGTAGSGNVNVNDVVSWSANTALTLTASNNVNVNANITATGTTAGLVVNPNTANGTETASGTGTFALNNGAAVTLSGASPNLSIAGQTYTVINSLGAQGSTTGTDLQGINGNTSGHYVLGSDINASATSGWNSGAGFTPIGSFSGVFNGLGHSIDNLLINSSGNIIGMFTKTPGGTIANVGLLGGSVRGGTYRVGGLVGINYGTVTNSYVTGSVTGSKYAGGLAGANRGTISNSYSTATISAFQTSGGLVGANYGTIRNSYATGAVTASYRLGGLVGGNFSTGTISGSHATGAVTGSSTVVGGLAGANYGTISNSYSSGAVSGPSLVGGLAGFSNSGTISNSYATGSVTGSTYVGGLLGANKGGNSTASSTITDTYATGTVTGTQKVGGLVGCNCGTRGVSTINNSYATGAVIGSTSSIYVGGLVGYNYANTPTSGTALDSASISNSYATGAVSAGTGSSNVGGLIGANLAHRSRTGPPMPTATVTNSYWDTSTTGQSTSAAGTGLSTAQMQQQSSFTGWDFSGTWIVYAGQTDPLLRSFMTPLTVTAVSGNQTYNGAGYSGADGVTYSVTPNTNLLGTLSFSASSQGPLSVGTYSVTPQGLYSNQQGYIISYASSTVTVTPAQLTVTGTTVANKVYDTTTAATLSGGTLSGVFGSDAVTLAQAGAFVSPNAGGSVGVTASDSISGTGAGNYTLVQPTGLTGNITPATLTVTGSGVANKVYDGTTAATLSGGTLSGIIGSDALALTQAGTFTSPNAGTGVAVTASDSISGAGASNYTLAQPTGLIANITPAALTVTGTAVANKVYDGTTGATLSGGTLSGVVGSDAVTLAQRGTFGSPNAGTGIAVTASDSLAGIAAGNYTLVQPTGLAANITPATLTVTGTNVADKVYDGTTAAALSGGTLSGVVGSDAVTLTQAGAFVSSNAGAGVAATASDGISGAGVSNYVLTQPTGLTADIAPAPLTYNALPNTTSSGRAPSGLAGTISGFISGDTLANATTGTLAWTTNATPSSPPGSYAIDGGGLSAANYVFIQGAGNAAALTVTASRSTPASIAGLESNVLPPTSITVSQAPSGAQFSTSPPPAASNAAAPTSSLTDGAAPTTASSGGAASSGGPSSSGGAAGSGDAAGSSSRNSGSSSSAPTIDNTIDFNGKGKLVIQDRGINLPPEAAGIY